MLPVLSSLLLLAIVSARLRRRVVLLGAIMITGMVFMFTPGIYDAVVRLVPYWLLVRLRHFGDVIGLVVVAGGLAWMMRPMLTTRLARQALALVVLCGSLAVFRENIQGYVLESRSQRQWLRDARSFQEVVAPVIVPHSLVAADPVWSLRAAVGASGPRDGGGPHHANPSDGGVIERFADAQELLAAETADDRRRAIIAKHGIDYIRRSLMTATCVSMPSGVSSPRKTDSWSTRSGYRPEYKSEMTRLLKYVMFLVILSGVALGSAYAGLKTGRQYERNVLCCQVPRDRNLKLSVRELLGRTAFPSQIGQDKWVTETVFPDVTDGFFLDVGSGDGTEDSNSKVLEQKGWTGICIDPFPTNMQDRTCLMLKEVVFSEAGKK